MPEWPRWLRSVWLGYTGQVNGEEGLVRTAARKYARQLHNGLSMASQVRQHTLAELVVRQFESLWTAS